MGKLDHFIPNLTQPNLTYTDLADPFWNSVIWSFGSSLYN